MEPLPQYEITVEGRLDSRWSEWFAPLSITFPSASRTRLRGPLADQAALLGLLRKLHDLGLSLMSVRRLSAGPAPAGSVSHEDR